MQNEKDMVNPEHYKKAFFETIDEMVIVFGAEAVSTYCKIAAWKYRARCLFKDALELDRQKADWYLQKSRELQVYIERSAIENASLTNLCVPISKYQNR